jgi:hypothetical protein
LLIGGDVAFSAHNDGELLELVELVRGAHVMRGG